jgi:hypothetical protein
MFSWGFLALSAVLGMFVGAAEIVSRYRDEPLFAMLSRSGFAYLALNGGVAAFAYFLLVTYGQSLLPAVTNDLLLTALAAGFGSMLVMRSKLLSFKTEAGEDFAVGLDAVISAFLSAIDRGVDRSRSPRRQDLVFKAAIEINDPYKALDFLSYSLASFQNLSDSEKASLNATIEAVRQQDDVDPKLKLMAVLFGFLNISGERNFETLVAHLKDYANSSQSDDRPPSQ